MPALKLKDKDGNWITLPTAKGDKGDPGATGATGAQGPQGTPTTVNGKSGSSITLTAADVGALPVSGGTMTGSLKMGYHSISLGDASIDFPEDEQELVVSTQNTEMRFVGAGAYPYIGLTDTSGSGQGVEIIGVHSPENDSSAANKGYVDEQVGTRVPYRLEEAGDFNDMTAPGVYAMRSCTLNAPSSESSYYSLWVGKSDGGDYVHQIAIVEGTALIYVRWLNGPNNWSDWCHVSMEGHVHRAENINSGILDSSRLPTVPVNKGGTGATTAAAARTALGAAPLASPVFTGTPKAPASSTSYTTYQLRNMALVTSAPTSLSNGAVALVYE